MSSESAESVLAFWFDEIKPKRWFIQDDAFDKELATRFGDLLSRAGAGKLDEWCDTDRGRLAPTRISPPPNAHFFTSPCVTPRISRCER